MHTQSPPRARPVSPHHVQVAGSPDLYPVLVELSPFPTLLACLGHENTDIAADTLEVLRELTDAGLCGRYHCWCVHDPLQLLIFMRC
jgi:hypothetical protein